MHVKHTAAVLSPRTDSSSASTPSLPRSFQPATRSCTSTPTPIVASAHQINSQHQHHHLQPNQTTRQLPTTFALPNSDLQDTRHQQNANSVLRHWDNDATVTTRRRKQFASRALASVPAQPERDSHSPVPPKSSNSPPDPDLDYCIYPIIPVSGSKAMTTTTTMTMESSNPSMGGDNPRPSMTDVMSARYTRIFGNLNPHVFQTACWIGIACLAAVGVYLHHGSKGAVEFITAYIVEYSLSIDNLFVFMVIFQYFRVSDAAQETALNWGVVGAMVLRGAMILLGKALVDKFHFVTVFFAGVLLYSSAKLLFTDDDDDEDLENNGIVKFAKRLFPCTDKYHGDRFFVVDADGRALATPLLVVLITVELSDVVFALDSVPAVLGLSKSTLVIYSSNILAVMGLRSLFFVVSDAIKDLRFLQQALALVLGFIGVKMIMASLLQIEIPVLLSLGLVVGTLFVGVLLSVLFPAPESESDEEEAMDPEDSAIEDDCERDQPPTEALLV